MKNFDDFILETLGINLDVKTLSDYIYNKISSSIDSKIITIFDNEVKTEKIVIDKIIIKIFNNKLKMSDDEKYNTVSVFRIDKSELTEKGLYAVIECYGIPTIYTIYHELNHALQFYYVGKQNSERRANRLKSFNIISDKLEFKKMQDFVIMYYISEDSEINSFISEDYKRLKDKLLQSKNINDNIFKKDFKNTFYDEIFKQYIKNTESYIHYQQLKDYDIYEELKNVSKSDMISFFNAVEDESIFLKKFYKNNFWNKIRLIINNINNFDNKRIEFVDNIDDRYNSLMKKYDNRFKTKSNLIFNKLTKLYDILKDEI